MATYAQIAEWTKTRKLEDGTTRELRLRIFEKDGVAAALDIPVLDGSSILQRSGAKSDLPVKSLKVDELRFTLKAANDPLIEKLLDAGYRQFKVTYESVTDNYLFFTGYVNPERFDDDLYETVQEIPVSCTGGLADLGAASVADTNATLDGLAEQVGTALDIPRELDVYTDLHPDERLASDPLPLELRANLSTAAGEDGNLADAVTSWLTAMGCVMFQRNGRLVIADPSHLLDSPGSVNSHISDGAGGYTNSQTDLLFAINKTNALRRPKYRRLEDRIKVQIQHGLYTRDNFILTDPTDIILLSGQSQTIEADSGIVAPGDVITISAGGEVECEDFIDQNVEGTVVWMELQIDSVTGGTKWYDQANDEWSDSQKQISDAFNFAALGGTQVSPFSLGDNKELPAVPDGFYGYFKAIARADYTFTEGDITEVEKLTLQKFNVSLNRATDDPRVTRVREMSEGSQGKVLTGSTYIGDADAFSEQQAFETNSDGAGSWIKTTSWTSGAKTDSLHPLVADRLGNVFIGKGFRYDVVLRDVDLISLLNVFEFLDHKGNTVHCRPVYIEHNSLRGYYEVRMEVKRSFGALASDDSYNSDGISGVGIAESSAGTGTSGSSSPSSPSSPGGGGVTDHGQLTGLNDTADHPWAMQKDFANAEWASPDSRYLNQSENGADIADAGTFRTNVGLQIGSDVQAHDAQLDTLATLGQAQADAMVAVSEQQYLWLGELDQGLKTTDNVRFNDIEVTGTINYVNETNLQVEDKTITVNKNGTDGSAVGAGLIVERPAGNKSFLWQSDYWDAGASAVRANAFNVGTTGYGFDSSGNVSGVNGIFSKLSADTFARIGGRYTEFISDSSDVGIYGTQGGQSGAPYPFDQGTWNQMIIQGRSNTDIAGVHIFAGTAPNRVISAFYNGLEVYQNLKMGSTKVIDTSRNFFGVNADLTGTLDVDLQANFGANIDVLGTTTTDVLDVAATSTFGGIATFDNTVISGSFDDVSDLIAGFRGTQAGDWKMASIEANAAVFKSFTAEVAQIFRGELSLSKSFGELAEDFTIPAVSSSATLKIYDVEGYGGFGVFGNDDIVELRPLNIGGGGLTIGSVFGTVTGKTDNGDGTQSYTFTTNYVQAAALVGKSVYAGSEARSYGSVASPVGVIRDTVFDSVPYRQIYTWDTNPWETANRNVVLQEGHLESITGSAETGLLIGDYAGGSYAKATASGLKIVGGNIDVTSLPRVSDEGLVGLWRFDGAGIDGYGEHDANFINGGSYARGLSGKGALLNGSGEYIEAPNTANDFEVGDHTFCAWTKMNTSTPGGQYIMGHYNWRIYWNGHNSVTFTTGRMNDPATGPTHSISSSVSNPEVWNFVVGVYNPSSQIIKLYVNGELKASRGIGTDEIATDYGSFNLRWGYSSHGGGSTAYNGYIDESRIYNRALSENEIKSLYLYPSGNSGGLISADTVVATTGFFSNLWATNATISSGALTLDGAILDSAANTGFETTGLFLDPQANRLSMGNTFSVDNGILTAVDGFFEGDITAVTGSLQNLDVDGTLTMGVGGKIQGTNWLIDEENWVHPSLGGPLTVQTKQLSYGTVTADVNDFTEEWDTPATTTTTNLTAQDAIVKRYKYRHRFGIKKLTLSGFAKRTINSFAGTVHKAEIRLIVNGTSVAREISVSSYAQFTAIEADVSGLTAGTLYDVEVQNYAEVTSNGSDLAETRTYLREDFIVESSTED